jgi:hypothetical protein
VWPEPDANNLCQANRSGREVGSIAAPRKFAIRLITVADVDIDAILLEDSRDSSRSSAFERFGTAQNPLCTQPLHSNLAVALSLQDEARFTSRPRDVRIDVPLVHELVDSAELEPVLHPRDRRRSLIGAALYRFLKGTQSCPRIF